MINFGIKKDKTLDFLRRDVKSVITMRDGKKESQMYYNENGDRTLINYFDDNESLKFKQVFTFQNGHKTGYINYDKFDNRVSFGEYELNEFGQVVSKYYNGELEEQYQYNEIGQVTLVYFPNTGAREIYEYDENNLIVKQLSILGENSLLVSLFSATKNKLTYFKNDRFGNIIQMKAYDYDSKQLLFTQNNKINEQGDEIESINLKADGTGYSEIFYYYDYDHKNNWIVKRKLDKVGNVKSQVIRQISYYSEADFSVD